MGAALLLLHSIAPSEACAQAPLLVPLPREASFGVGVLALRSTIAIGARDANERNVASFIAAALHSRGIGASIVPGAQAVTVHLSDRAADPILGSEGYRLRVDRSGIAIAANSGAGLFYGFQTLDQIMPFGHGTISLPFTLVVDWPRYRWRGIHLDVSRHFFGVAVVERYIDLAARYKLNVFHWHLTDDQGWRVPIARYPLLTNTGGCRAGTQVGGEGSTQTDGKRYCGAYTAAEIRAVVAYARARYVNVVPEIEMPGHSVEALAAYPWLGCANGPYRVRQLWGVSAQIFCPTERTFGFIDDVVREVAGLFPGPFVHIGGDEVPKDSWKANAGVAALMRREHLRTLEEVQGYFTRRVERIALRYGRRIAGWDEIVGSGVSREAIVMAWHGNDAATAAARRGNDVVQSPDGTLYLDADQGNPDYEPLGIGGLTTTEMVYDYDPAPRSLNGAEQRHILGPQANLWTEYVPTASHLFYMLLPRELALAAIAWTPQQRRNWPDFTRRLGPQLARFEREGIAFRIPLVTYSIAASRVAFGEQQPEENTTTLRMNARQATLSLDEVVPDATIHFTTDGSRPTTRSKIYATPAQLTLAPEHATVVGAMAELPSGRISAPSFLRIESGAVP